MISADTSRFSQFISNGDYEDGSAEAIIQNSISIRELSINGGSILNALPPSSPSSSMQIQDYAVSLIPIGTGPRRYYELILKDWFNAQSDVPS